MLNISIPHLINVTTLAQFAEKKIPLTLFLHIVPTLRSQLFFPVLPRTNTPMGKYCPPNNTPCQEYFFETVFNINVSNISQLVDIAPNVFVTKEISPFLPECPWSWSRAAEVVAALQPGCEEMEREMRKWRGNGEKMKYLRGNGERMRKWTENEEMGKRMRKWKEN